MIVSEIMIVELRTLQLINDVGAVSVYCSHIAVCNYMCTLGSLLEVFCQEGTRWMKWTSRLMEGFGLWEENGQRSM